MQLGCFRLSGKLPKSLCQEFLIFNLYVLFSEEHNTASASWVNERNDKLTTWREKYERSQGSLVMARSLSSSSAFSAFIKSVIWTSGYSRPMIGVTSTHLN